MGKHSQEESRKGESEDIRKATRGQKPVCKVGGFRTKIQLIRLVGLHPVKGQNSVNQVGDIWKES